MKRHNEEMTIVLYYSIVDHENQPPQPAAWQEEIHQEYRETGSPIKQVKRENKTLEIAK